MPSTPESASKHFQCSGNTIYLTWSEKVAETRLHICFFKSLTLLTFLDNILKLFYYPRDETEKLKNSEKLEVFKRTLKKLT